MPKCYRLHDWQTQNRHKSLMPGDILGPFYDCIKYISDTPHSFNPQFPQTALTLVHWIARVCTCHILPKHCCNHVHPFMSTETIFPLSRIIHPDTQPEWIRNGFKAQQRVWGVDRASRFHRSLSNQESVGCAGQNSPIHGGSTSQPAAGKWSVGSVRYPNTL